MGQVSGGIKYPMQEEPVYWARSAEAYATRCKEVPTGWARSAETLAARRKKCLPDGLDRRTQMLPDAIRAYLMGQV